MKTGHAFQAASVTSESKLRQQNQRKSKNTIPYKSSSVLIKKMELPYFFTRKSPKMRKNAGFSTIFHYQIYQVS